MGHHDFDHRVNGGSNTPRVTKHEITTHLPLERMVTTDGHKEERAKERGDNTHLALKWVWGLARDPESQSNSVY
jgi:hypothetical protein